jgi:SAM-dependent methyltransferase
VQYSRKPFQRVGPGGERHFRFVHILFLGIALLWGSLSNSAAQTPDDEITPHPDAKKWDSRYSTDRFVYGTEPTRFLLEQIHKLPRGRALCLAAGEGRNAVFLAQQGYQVLAVDISAKGLEKTKLLATARGVSVKTLVADLETYDLGQNQWDLITNFYYHKPSIYKRIMPALKPGGMFILENFSVDQPKTNRFGPKNPKRLVEPNSLLQLFSGYRIRYYEDTVVPIDEGMHKGRGAVVRLLVQKTPVP